MNSIAIAGIVFACCFCAALAGLFCRLPADHLDSDSKETVRLVMGLIATIAALVLSLLISSANSAFDTQASELRQVSADVSQLDRMLVLYGPETKDIREILRAAVTAAHQRIWYPEEGQQADLNPLRARAAMDVLYTKLQNLTPKTAAQSRAQDAAWQLAGSLIRMRMLMYEQLSGSVPWPLLAVLTFWVSVLFFGFGLFSRFHTTLVVAMVLGAASVGGAIFLILELNQPYSGVIRLSDAPIRNALASMER